MCSWTTLDSSLPCEDSSTFEKTFQLRRHMSIPYVHLSLGRTKWVKSKDGPGRSTCNRWELNVLLTAYQVKRNQKIDFGNQSVSDVYFNYKKIGVVLLINIYPVKDRVYGNLQRKFIFKNIKYNKNRHFSVKL